MAHTWVTGEVITAKKLNTLEQAVAGHNSVIEWARQEINGFDSDGDGVVDVAESCHNIAESVVSPIVASETEFPTVVEGEKVKISFGKFIKWMADARSHMKTSLLSVGSLFTVGLSSVQRSDTLATSDDSKEIANTEYVKANLRRYSSNDNGVVDQAVYAATSGNATTINNYTVSANVPSNAAFTDTTDLSRMTGTIDLASQVSGVLGLSHIPQGAMERLKTVANQAARYALTTADVQNGDSVKQLDTGIMYVVVDDTNLDNANGYMEYSVGSAAYANEAGTLSNVLPTTLGGTGQTSLQATRNAMGLGNTTGALPVENGGTGRDTLTSGSVLIGNGTSQVELRGFDSTPTSGSNKMITSGAVADAISQSGGGSVTSITAGAGLAGGTITSSGTIKANLKSETRSSLTAASKGSTSSREYAVGLDANGKLSVNVPWTDTTSGTTDSIARNMIRSTSSDAYSSSKAYSVGEHVIYSNKLYKCITACSAAAWSVNQNCFEETTLTAAVTELNSDLSNQATSLSSVIAALSNKQDTLKFKFIQGEIGTNLDGNTGYYTGYSGLNAYSFPGYVANALATIPYDTWVSNYGYGVATINIRDGIVYLTSPKQAAYTVRLLQIYT